MNLKLGILYLCKDSDMVDLPKACTYERNLKITTITDVRFLSKLKPLLFFFDFHQYSVIERDCIVSANRAVNTNNIMYAVLIW